MVALDRKQIVQNAKNLVVKVGTNVLTTADGRLNTERVRRLVGELCAIHARGVNTTWISALEMPEEAAPVLAGLMETKVYDASGAHQPRRQVRPRARAASLRVMRRCMNGLLLDCGSVNVIEYAAS